MQTLLEIRKAFLSDDNYKNYRDAIGRLHNSPCLPFLGINLEDLTAIDESQATLIQENNLEFVNFLKMASIGDIVSEIHQFQNHCDGFEIQENPELVLYFLSLPTITEKDALEKSTKLELQK